MTNIALGILISGRGSNMDALIKASQSNKIDAEVRVVISDQPTAKGIEIAKSYGITTFSLDVNSYPTKKDYEQVVIRALKGCGVDIICLAGYMRLVGSDLLDAFKNRILNIHPSLLPSFKGLNAQKQAFDYGVKFSGCTVHYVTSMLDSGPIISQAVVEVKPNDTVNDLSTRILEQEHWLYPQAVQKVINELLITKGK